MLCNFWNWLIREELAESNPLWKIKAPKTVGKIIKGLPSSETNRLLAAFDKSFSGRRNKAIVIVLVDYGLRLGGLLNLTLADPDVEHQLLKVS